MPHLNASSLAALEGTNFSWLFLQKHLSMIFRYVNPISIRRGRLCPTIGFASPKFFSWLHPCFFKYCCFNHLLYVFWLLWRILWGEHFQSLDSIFIQCYELWTFGASLPISAHLYALKRDQVAFLCNQLSRAAGTYWDLGTGPHQFLVDN